MKGLNLSSFKKIAEDKHSATMKHADGHTLKIAKSALPALQRKQLEKLPLYKADGGDSSTTPDQSQPDQTSNLINQNAAALQKEDPTLSLGDAMAKAAIAIQNTKNNTDAEATQASNEAALEKSRMTLPTEPVPGQPLGVTPDQGYAPNAQTAAAVGALPPADPNLPGAGTPITPPSSNTSTSTPSQAGTSVPSATDSLNLNSVYGNEVKAIKDKRDAEANLATDQAQIEHQNQQNLQDAQTNWNITSGAMQKSISDALEDVKNGHINPNHYMGSMDAGQKVATGIGLLLGGFSSAFTHQGNPAMDFLNKQIDRDVAAQKDNQNTKLNVYNGYLDQYKNAAVAENMTRATQMGIYASKIREAIAKAGTPLAIANGNMAITQLQQQMIPLVQNAHLLQQAGAFNGTQGGGSGSEAQYKTVLANSQRINPEFYKDAQSKYVPGVGVASHAVAPADAERLAKMNSLSPLVDKAIADQESYGNIGAWSVKNRADANSDRDAIQVSLNEMTGLNRLNDSEYKNYGKQVGNIGGVNMGGSLQSLKNLKAQLDSDKNSQMTSMGITPFSQAQQPSGLNQQQQQVLQQAQTMYPNASQGDLIKALRSQGKI